MGDYEDFCKSLSLSGAADWDDVEERTLAASVKKSERSAKSAAELSEIDRPKGLPEEVRAAFQAAELPLPEVSAEDQYAYQFALATGGSFKLYFRRDGRPTGFNMLRGSPNEVSGVRIALQLHMRRPCAADLNYWSRSRERKLREVFFLAPYRGIWIDHKPLKTQVVLRRTRYSPIATTPGLDKSKRLGMVIILHEMVGRSRVLARLGDPTLRRLLENELTVFGLIDLPQAERGGAGVQLQQGVPRSTVIHPEDTAGSQAGELA